MTIKLVRNEEEASEVIVELQNQGYLAENIYALAHDKERTAAIVEGSDANHVGVAEQGIIRTVANLFRSRGEELIAKMESLGISRPEAEHYEQLLDNGDILIVTWPGAIEQEDYNPELERDRDRAPLEPVVNPLLFAGTDPNRFQ
ncbi:MAG: ral stress protein [Paenibacillaceae bacterium]|jgi:hypothetical protein|nr:ral stress protein [Paenibacillaceae bacterium]